MPYQNPYSVTCFFLFNEAFFVLTNYCSIFPINLESRGFTTIVQILTYFQLFSFKINFRYKFPVAIRRCYITVLITKINGSWHCIRFKCFKTSDPPFSFIKDRKYIIDLRTVTVAWDSYISFIRYIVSRIAKYFIEVTHVL